LKKARKGRNKKRQRKEECVWEDQMQFQIEEFEKNYKTLSAKGFMDQEHI